MRKMNQFFKLIRSKYLFFELIELLNQLNSTSDCLIVMSDVKTRLK